MIELFKQPNLNWMGKAKYFYALSGILLLAGWASIFFGSGIRYGIDFKGGTNVDVRFSQAPNIDRLRSSLSAQGLGNTEIQSIRDIGTARANEVLIFVGGKGQEEATLDASRGKVLSALNAEYKVEASGKPDFNSATPASLDKVLNEKDPLFLSVNAGDRYQQLAKRLLDYRDTESNGILTNFDDLSRVTGATPAVVNAVKSSFALGPFAIRNIEIVGPKVGAELRQRAIQVTLYALAGMLVYIAFRFQGGASAGQLFFSQSGFSGFVLRMLDKAIYGLAAVLAVFHDVLITLGFFSLLRFEISLTVIAALLTLVDRKSTRLNSSHSSTSYAVFCLKKKRQESFAYAHLPRKHSPPRSIE